jgi:hypothetical protein
MTRGEHRPTNGSFRIPRLASLDRQADGSEIFEQAVLYQQRSATIHDHLGDLYKKQGQTDKARAKWEDTRTPATEPDDKKDQGKLGKK